MTTKTNTTQNLNNSKWGKNNQALIKTKHQQTINKNQNLDRPIAKSNQFIF